MEKEKFIETVSLIIRMASTGLMKAVVETDYMENVYESVHYQSLDASIEIIS